MLCRFIVFSPHYSLNDLPHSHKKVFVDVVTLMRLVLLEVPGYLMEVQRKTVIRIIYLSSEQLASPDKILFLSTE